MPKTMTEPLPPPSTLERLFSCPSCLSFKAGVGKIWVGFGVVGAVGLSSDAEGGGGATSPTEINHHKSDRDVVVGAVGLSSDAEGGGGASSVSFGTGAGKISVGIFVV